jgi:hypothetical protein
MVRMSGVRGPPGDALNSGLPMGGSCLHKRAMSEPGAPDTVVDLRPWDLALRRAVSRPRALAALEADDARAAVQALGELEVYHAIKSIGAEDATPILALISVEQARTLFDLDVWHRAELDLADVLTWMAAFREAGIGALETAARALDPEALALLFRRRLLITLVPKEDASDPEPLPEWAAEPPDEILPLITTPDGRFIVAARAQDEEAEDEEDEPLDEEERKGVLRLVDELYRTEDFEWVAGLLRLASTDLSSNLHEDAQRFREGRMEDLGFPPLERALEVYGPLDPAVLADPAPLRYPRVEQSLPAAFAAPLSNGLFHAAMRRLDDPRAVSRIEGDLVPLANAALVADGAEPGQLDHLQDTLSRARGYIELALAHGTSAGQAERLETAAQRLAQHHVTTLFRVGYTLTLRAAGRARALVRGGALAAEGDALGLLSDPERHALEALVAKRPRFSEALTPWAAALARGEDPQAPLDEAQQHVTRAFEAPEELAAVEALLRDAEALAAVAPTLTLEGADEALPPPEERPAQLRLATAAAWALLGQTPGLRPLDADALADLADRLQPPGRFSPEAAAAAQAEVAARFGASLAVARRVTLGLAELAESLWPLVGAPVDPRFVAGVLVAVDAP